MLYFLHIFTPSTDITFLTKLCYQVVRKGCVIVAVSLCECGSRLFTLKREIIYSGCVKIKYVV